MIISYRCSEKIKIFNTGYCGVVHHRYLRQNYRITIYRKICQLGTNLSGKKTTLHQIFLYLPLGVEIHYVESTSLFFYSSYIGKIKEIFIANSALCHAPLYNYKVPTPYFVKITNEIKMPVPFFQLPTTNYAHTTQQTSHETLLFTNKYLFFPLF